MCELCREYGVKPEYQRLMHEAESGVIDSWLRFFKPGAIKSNSTLTARSRGEMGMVHQSISQGNLDENKLTNLVFFNRHKNLAGKKLSPGQPGYDAMSKEWLYIRNNIVRPILNRQKSKRASSTELQSYLARMKPVLPAIEKYRGNIPLEFILGWIKTESGGIITTIPKYKAGTKDLNERGYFQISKEESTKLKFDHPRLSSDPQYSVQCGIILINHYAQAVKNFGINESNPVFWNLVKLWHAASGIATTIMRFAQSNNYKLSDWNDLQDYILNRQWKNFEASLRKFNNIADKKSYVTRLFNNVDNLLKWAGYIKNELAK